METRAENAAVRLLRPNFLAETKYERGTSESIKYLNHSKVVHKEIFENKFKNLKTITTARSGICW